MRITKVGKKEFSLEIPKDNRHTYVNGSSSVAVLCIHLLWIPNQYFLFTHIDGHVNARIAKILIISKIKRKSEREIIIEVFRRS